MTDLQRNYLNKLIGVPKSYEHRNITIHKFVEGDGFVTIHATGGNMNLNDDEIDGFFIKLGEPLSLAEMAKRDAVANAPENAQEAVPALQGYTPTAENVELKSMLMATLRAVQNDAAAIPQAKAIFDGARTMVEIQKSEFEMIRLTKKGK